MAGKIAQSRQMNDKMSFTKMSKNVLNAPYKDQYVNVYQKGALIAMCVDILIRENSNGKKGILNLMQDLATEYGTKKAFKDEELFGKITELTFQPDPTIFKDTIVFDLKTIIDRLRQQAYLVKKLRVTVIDAREVTKKFDPTSVGLVS